MAVGNRPLIESRSSFSLQDTATAARLQAISHIRRTGVFGEGLLTASTQVGIPASAYRRQNTYNSALIGNLFGTQCNSSYSSWVLILLRGPFRFWSSFFYYCCI